MPGGAAARTERLMCLVFAIKARGRRGITRAQLRASIADYADSPSEEAFARMFERDKEDLREIGIGLDAVLIDAYHGDEFAYVLSEGALLEQPLHFDADELRLLALASESWDRGTWEAAARGALRKLEVFSDAFPVESAPRVSLTPDLHLESVRRAIRERRSIAFQYRRPGDSIAAPRRLEPWGMLNRGGAWYCVGHDLDRGAARVFRTSRIESAVAEIGPATAPIDPAWPDIVRGEAPTTVLVATTLLVRPDQGWTWRRDAMPQGSAVVAGSTYDRLEVTLPDDGQLAGRLAAAAPAVLVQEPADLRLQVMARLEEVARG